MNKSRLQLCNMCAYPARDVIGMARMDICICLVSFEERVKGRVFLASLDEGLLKDDNPGDPVSRIKAAFSSTYAGVDFSGQRLAIVRVLDGSPLAFSGQARF
jgi:hypothetical protein